ncbi:MAG: hypothetical protein A2Z88_07165 [Omnitrophica WOR_2 bacterium GWA2_47_8]|nr:MAG: hypothetical protein A2Z88_07165 [Omnitrophica WOR_2 bacterium GWA2_47_8]
MKAKTLAVAVAALYTSLVAQPAQSQTPEWVTPDAAAASLAQYVKGHPNSKKYVQYLYQQGSGVAIGEEWVYHLELRAGGESIKADYIDTPLFTPIKQRLDRDVNPARMIARDFNYHKPNGEIGPSDLLIVTGILNERGSYKTTTITDEGPDGRPDLYGSTLNSGNNDDWINLLEFFTRHFMESRTFVEVPRNFFNEQLYRMEQRLGR